MGVAIVVPAPAAGKFGLAVEDPVKRFTLEEANALIPELNLRLEAIQVELAPLQQALAEANDALLDQEWKLRQARQEGAPRIALDELQIGWDEAAAHLVATRRHLEGRQQAWTRLMQRLGVIVRDLTQGKIDLPVRDSDINACFCWTQGEASMTCWHPLHQHGTGWRLPLTELA